MVRHFRTIHDLNKEEILSLFATCREMKKYPERYGDAFQGRTLAMIFQKPSLRTRVTFETGIFQMGGQGIYLGPNDISLGKRESTGDIAANLSRWVDVIMIRTFGHHIVDELATHSMVPVINGLSDLCHPCQALADIFTLYERRKHLDQLKLAYVGDGNNVLHSLIEICATLGTDLAYATPEGYEPSAEILAKSKARAEASGSNIQGFRDPIAAVKDADAVYTDVWASMGQESEAEARKKIFAPYQVNNALMAFAKNGAWFMHCLPAHRGDEVTDEVIDSHSSVVLDQAENRMHTQKALMYLLAKY